MFIRVRKGCLGFQVSVKMITGRGKSCQGGSNGALTALLKSSNRVAVVEVSKGQEPLEFLP